MWINYNKPYKTNILKDKTIIWKQIDEKDKSLNVSEKREKCAIENDIIRKEWIKQNPSFVSDNLCQPGTLIEIINRHGIKERLLIGDLFDDSDYPALDENCIVIKYKVLYTPIELMEL